MNRLQQIWSHPECVFLIFAGSSAEFALNPAADWLFYTGHLPNDPIDRFASTVTYAQQIIFAGSPAAQSHLVEHIKGIHHKVETERGYEIPAVAYRDVLLMIMAYTLKAYPLVFGSDLTDAEKDFIIGEMASIWHGMNIIDAPHTFQEFVIVRQEMFSRFTHTEWTPQLLASYEHTLGKRGYYYLIVTYRQLLDPALRENLGLAPSRHTWFLKPFFQFMSKTRLIRLLYRAMLPARLGQMLKVLDETSQKVAAHELAPN
jgi:hypothetical protein